MAHRVLAATAALIFLATSSVALHAQQSQSGQSGPKDPKSATAAKTKAVERLQAASEKLRETIRSLQMMGSGPQRDKLVKEAREALEDTERAMAQLPPEWKVAAKSGAYPAPLAEPRDLPVDPGTAAKHLQMAAYSLYGAIHAMVKLPAGPSRNDAIQRANEALFETEQAAMLSELKYKRRSS